MTELSGIPDGLVHRDTIIASPGSGPHTATLLPWAEAARVIIKGGDAGRPDGSKGDDGYVIVELYGKPEEQP